MYVDSKVSIVIPVYNVEKYLSQCLESVVRQTYHNLEIICVNDGSTDNSLKILKGFQKKDSRIIIINQENKGLSAARNTGLENITSDYVTFIDSDDYVDPRYVEILHKRLFLRGADFAICSALPIGNNKVDNLNFLKFYRNHMNWVATVPLNPNLLVPNSWGKLFKMDIIKKYHLRFPEPLICEDQYWHFLYCAVSSRYTLIREPLYYYRRDNPNSIMSKDIFQQNKRSDIIKICCCIHNAIQKNPYSDFYQERCDELFWRELRTLVVKRNNCTIDKVLLGEIKKYLIYSKKMEQRFQNSELFNMIEPNAWK